MARWAANDPAAALVLPRADSRICGGGEMDFRAAGQAVVSGLAMRERLGDVWGRASRRAMAWTRGFEGWKRRDDRIWEPTRPVQPKRAADGLELAMMGYFTMSIRNRYLQESKGPSYKYHL